MLLLEHAAYYFRFVIAVLVTRRRKVWKRVSKRDSKPGALLLVLGPPDSEGSRREVEQQA